MKFSYCILTIFITLLVGCRVSKRMSAETELNNINQILAISNFDSTFIDEIKRNQKTLVAGLTGKEEVNESQTINRRWTDDERNIARNFLGDMLKKIDLPLYINSYETNNPYGKPIKLLTGTNIYTIIPATTESSEYVILGAHFDTVEESTGASDNASGCALVYGVGMALSKISERKKNVILIFFDQEERGLLGSLSFVSFIKEEGYNVHSVHTVDQIGWDEDGDRNIEIEKPSSELKALYKSKSDEIKITSYRTGVTSSDHKAFRDAGFNAIGITEEYKHGDTSPHYHKMSDKYETVNFEYLAHSTLLVFSVIETIVTSK